MVQKTRNL